jgi:ubiquinone/menaquinone biosynthesis C-methylase UbiE
LTDPTHGVKMLAMSSQDHFDRWAPRYDRSLLQRLMFEPIHEAVLTAYSAAAPAPGDVLDVGCGTGRLLEAAGRRWGEVRLTGVDVSDAMIAEARRKHERDARFRFERADAATLPLDTAAFDAAFSTMSFHHWADQLAGVREVARVLRPGGLFVLADIEVPLLTLLRPLLDRLDRARFLRPDEIQRLLEAAGLSAVSRRRCRRIPPTQLFVARKG